ncbi:MAG: formylglycine-generating enzyme family protein [Bacteroidota bacterium]
MYSSLRGFSSFSVITLLLLISSFFIACDQKQANAQVAKQTTPKSVSPPNPMQAHMAAVEGDIKKIVPGSFSNPYEGMIKIPAGEIELGSIEGLPREKPTSFHKVNSFYMDKSPVTVGQYRKFIEATGYQTEAERFGNSIVHDMRGRKEWHLVNGANWQFPRGPEGGKAPDDHPVTQVSYNDARAYCKWAGKRLPKEVEWEHAARNGDNSREQYSWGEEIKVKGVYKANYWQGSFPFVNEEKDGFLYTSPVGKFGATPIGLTDMAGNVWEWCEDWYKMYGKDGKYIETTPGQRERVMRGGSFMCEPGFCHGYRVSGRSGTSPESALFHLGFRCVKDIET